MAIALCLASACGDGGSSADDGQGTPTEGGDATDAEPSTGDDPDTGNDPDTGSDPDDTGSDTEPGPGLDDSYDPDACMADLFVEPAPHPKNAGYPDPELTASCTDSRLTVQSNGIPGYEFQQITPNDLQAQNHSYSIPRTPTVGNDDDIPLLNVAAFAINGMPIFGPNEAEMPDPFGDPIYNGIMDFCLGHTAMAGVYHYHGVLVECLVGEVPADEPSPIIGFALDGYPIFGPVGCLDAECTEVVRFESGWVQTGDPSTYAWDNHEFQASEDPTVLDRCNGRVGPDGNYRYHATDTFPYVLGCYHGEA